MRQTRSRGRWLLHCWRHEATHRPRWGQWVAVRAGAAVVSARTRVYLLTSTCMKLPSVDTEATLILVPVFGTCTLAQPKLPMAGFGATQ